MPDTRLSILIVDDAKFSSAVIHKTITSAGYTDIRHAASARDAIALLEERTADIIIADWLMPEMDGLELTQHIRQQDEQKNRYTYIILLTAREGVEALATAFDEGVDDFVNKSVMNQQLLPRIYAAERLVNNQNRLLQENRRLVEANAQLRKLSTLDPITGLGNLNYTVKRLEDTLRHAKSRDGAACYLLIEIANYRQLQQQLPDRMFRQLIVSISRRLQQLVRPLDIVTRIAPNRFTLITHQPDIHHCTAACFRRLHDGLNLKPFKTPMGFSQIRAGISIGATDYQQPIPEPQKLMALAEAHIEESHQSNRIVVHYWQTSGEVALED